MSHYGQSLTCGALLLICLDVLHLSCKRKEDDPHETFRSIQTGLKLAPLYSLHFSAKSIEDTRHVNEDYTHVSVVPDPGACIANAGDIAASWAQNEYQIISRVLNADKPTASYNLEWFTRPQSGTGDDSDGE